MAGAINTIDVTQSIFELLTGKPADETERIRAVATKIAEAEQPALPSSGLPAQVEALPLNPSVAALSPEELAARFGIGREVDVTVGVSVPSPTVQKATPLVIAPVAVAPLVVTVPSAPPQTVAPAVAPEIAQAPLARPTEDARQPAAIFDTGPDAEARRSEQLSALAGLAINNPEKPLPVAVAHSPAVAPIVIDSIDGSATTHARGRRGIRSRVRNELTGNAPFFASVTARQNFEQSLGIGARLDMAA